MKRSLLVIFYMIAIIFLGGCSRYIQWGTDVFYQNPLIESCGAQGVCYVRSLHLYDQFTTVAHFDALWLSDEVKTEYANLYATKHHVSNDRYQLLLDRELEENNHYISFYVLATFPKQENILLTDKASPWTLTLSINGVTFHPIEIKTVVDLAPEYRLMFGKLITKFKTVYRVKFDARDIEGNDLLGRAECVELLFNAICRPTAVMSWQLPCVCDYNVGDHMLAYDL